MSASRTGVAALALAAAMAVACGSEPPEAGDAAATPSATMPPNVLLLTLDTTRADALGSYGQPLATTPHLDRLAARGVRFEHCVTPSPSTLPAHASILTGQYPTAHGARSNAGYVLAAEHETLAEALARAGYATAAEIAAPVIGRHTGLAQGFDRYRDLTSPGVRRRVIEVPGPEGSRRVTLDERDAADVTDGGIAFLEGADGPFFLWLHYFDPHRSYTPPEPHRSRIPESRYHAEIRFVDHEIGRLLAALDRLDLRQRTLVVVTADHGEGLGEHGEPTHSLLVYDTTVRVPLILAGAPVGGGGRSVEALVRSIDIAPTILDLLDLEPLPDAQGVSLAPLLARGSREPALSAYGESIEAHTAFGAAPLRFLRDGAWKYIHKVNPELYDVLRDPDELENRIADEPEVAARLLASLQRLVEQSGDSPDGRIPLDAAAAERLRALGYVAAGARANTPQALASTELNGADPNTLLEAWEWLSDGWGSLKHERFEVAAEKFRALLDEHPESLPALEGLGDSLASLGRFDEAADALGRALAMAPDRASLRARLGRVEAHRGRLKQAEALLRGALASEPCLEYATLALAAVLDARGRPAKKHTLLRDAVARCPDSLGLRNDYAYHLATARDPALRDGDEALRIADEVAKRSGDLTPEVLDTMAAAHAELGRFAEAVELSRRALALAEARGVPADAAAVLQRNLASFEAGRPVRE